MANQIGVPVSTYREWENGRSIRGEFYIKIAIALEISVYELLTGSQPAISDLIASIEKIEAILEAIKVALNSYG